MFIKNIKTNFDLTGELIDSESLTYLKIRFTDKIIKYGLIDDYREINHLEETVEEFRERVLIAYEITNVLYEINEDENRPPWEKRENWWKNENRS